MLSGVPLLDLLGVGFKSGGKGLWSAIILLLSSSLLIPNVKSFFSWTILPEIVPDLNNGIFSPWKSENMMKNVATKMHIKTTKDESLRGAQYQTILKWINLPTTKNLKCQWNEHLLWLHIKLTTFETPWNQHFV